MYRWVVFVHVAGVFGFLLAHGGSVNMLLRVRRERDRGKIATMLDMSTSSYNLMYASLGVLLLGGIVAGFMGGWWGRLWIWTALVLLIATMMAMYVLANTYYHRVRRAVGLPYMEKWYRSSESPAEPAAPPEQIDAILSEPRPLLIAAVGVTGLLAILWLMLFKPF